MLEKTDLALDRLSPCTVRKALTFLWVVNTLEKSYQLYVVTTKDSDCAFGFTGDASMKYAYFYLNNTLSMCIDEESLTSAKLTC